MFEACEACVWRVRAVVQPGIALQGDVAALMIVVVWVYYGAMIFILGGEVAQVYELRRVRRLQREAFED